MKMQSISSGGSVVGTQVFNGTASVDSNSVYTLGLDVTGVVTPDGSGISLKPGWNLVSLPIMPYNTKISKVLSTLIAAKDFTIVWGYQGGAWKSATLSNGVFSTAGGLTTMQDGFGYWIYMTTADKLNVVGYVIAPPPAPPPTYSLSKGWNLVGFKPQPTVQNETVDQYLSSISGSYDANNVWVYDNLNGSWIRATASTELAPGEAMWIFVTPASGGTLSP